MVTGWDLRASHWTWSSPCEHGIVYQGTQLSKSQACLLHEGREEDGRAPSFPSPITAQSLGGDTSVSSHLSIPTDMNRRFNTKIYQKI